MENRKNEFVRECPKLPPRRQQTWDEFVAEADFEDERPPAESQFRPNPDYDPNYVPPKDELPF
jgi:hypothetical protein